MYSSYVIVIFRFPPVHFGKLFGMVMALSAVVSLLQYPCFALIKGPLGGDPLYVSLKYCTFLFKLGWRIFNIWITTYTH